MPCRTHAQDVLFDLQNILKSGNINFHAKIAQNLQIFKHCTNRSRSHMHACNTGFESPEHILFSSEKSGYHWGTVRTQEIQFSILFRNLPKLDRLNPQMEFYRKIWYPSGTQNFMIISTRSKLFNAVSTVCTAILDQTLQPTEKKYVYTSYFKNGEISC